MRVESAVIRVRQARWHKSPHLLPVCASTQRLPSLSPGSPNSSGETNRRHTSLSPHGSFFSLSFDQLGNPLTPASGIATGRRHTITSASSMHSRQLWVREQHSRATCAEFPDLLLSFSPFARLLRVLTSTVDRLVCLVCCHVSVTRKKKKKRTHARTFKSFEV